MSLQSDALHQSGTSSSTNMKCMIIIASLLIALQSIGSDDVLEIGHGQCRRQWIISERRTEYLTHMKRCSLYERCINGYKTVTKSRTKIIDRPMHVDFCCEGYINVGSSDHLLCDPTCEPMCVNGVCVAPGNCSCKEGYVKSPSSNHICEHKCTPECVNATCIGVNNCDCYAGFFKKDPGSLSHTCSPRCTYGCVHGDCTAPEICTCHPGYTLSSNHSICLPVCNLECTNGICSGPNTCTCNEGYVETLTWNICDPYCSEPCSNGQCTSPENCTCWEGYFKTSNSTCDPHCSDACQNGACIAPDICSCNNGYEKDENGTCIPICSLGCEDGNCVSPDNCLCNDHHYYSNGTCVPWCADGCTNGDCTGPNECSCHQDTFRMSQSYCAQSCLNVSECVDRSSSVVNGNLTSLTLIWNPTMYSAIENHPALCTQEFSQSCCSIGLNFTQDDSLVIVCSPKEENIDCDQWMYVPNYLWFRQYDEGNGTHATIIMVMTNNHNHEPDARSCYVQICPGPGFSFESGLTNILCSTTDSMNNLKVNESDEGYLIPVVTPIGGVLIVLTAFIVLAAILFYYVKRVRGISYTVNDSGAPGESTAQLCYNQEVPLEDEF